MSRPKKAVAGSRPERTTPGGSSRAGRGRQYCKLRWLLSAVIGIFQCIFELKMPRPVIWQRFTSTNSCHEPPLPHLEHKPTHSTPTSRQLFYMPATSAPDDPQRTRDAGPRRTTETHDIPLSSAAQLRAPPRLPHFTFASSDVKRREPPGKTARSSAEDRGSISARLAPAVDRDAQPAPRSRPERPRSREHEPRLTCNVRRCTVCFRGKCGVLAGLSRHISKNGYFNRLSTEYS